MLVLKNSKHTCWLIKLLCKGWQGSTVFSTLNQGVQEHSKISIQAYLDKESLTPWFESLRVFVRQEVITHSEFFIVCILPSIVQRCKYNMLACNGQSVCMFVCTYHIKLMWWQSLVKKKIKVATWHNREGCSLIYNNQYSSNSIVLLS